MNAEIKKCADENDIKGLRYIFVDCLDVDPTFESYKEDYEYCKDIKGFLAEYEEITPLKLNSSDWNEDYWVKLKVDLLKNFSEKRFLHMIQVAKVVKADKIRRLQQERQRVKQGSDENIISSEKRRNDNNRMIVSETRNSFDVNAQRKSLEAAQRELQLENERMQAEIDRKERQRVERAEKLRAEESARKQQQQGSASNSSKKAMGIVGLVAIVLLAIALAAVLR